MAVTCAPFPMGAVGRAPGGTGTAGGRCDEDDEGEMLGDVDREEGVAVLEWGAAGG